MVALGWFRPMGDGLWETRSGTKIGIGVVGVFGLGTGGLNGFGVGLEGMG